MFKIGQKYIYLGNNCTVHLLSKDKIRALIKYDNPLLGHKGEGHPDYYHNDNGDKVNFTNNKSTGFWFITGVTSDLIPITESADYEIY